MENYFLTSQSRTVLKGLINISSGTDCEITFHGSSLIASDTNNSFSFEKYSGEINSILNQLSSGGFIALSNHGYSLRLTQEGLHYFQYQRARFHAYVLDKLFDALALIISATALGMSIAALIK